MKSCKRHPKYKAIRKPANCFKCRAAYVWRRLKKALGFLVIERAPAVKPVSGVES